MNEKIRTAAESRRLQFDKLQKEQERHQKFFSNLYFFLLVFMILTAGSCGMLCKYTTDVAEKQENLLDVVTDQGREIDQLKQKNKLIENTIAEILQNQVVGEQ